MVEIGVPLPTVTILSQDALSVNAMLSTVAPASTVYPSANRAIFVPFNLFAPAIAYSMVVENGTAVSGNIDMGIYSLDGTRIVSKGSTAQSGTSTKQQLTFSNRTQLGAGLYYMALACDNTTATFFRRSISSNICKAIGMAQAATSFVLPATVTFATVSSSYIPIFGVKFYNV